MLTQWTVGWLLLALAVVVFGAGFGLRWFIGRPGDTDRAQALAFSIRKSLLGRIIFGPMDDRSLSDRQRTTLDGDELDQLIVMPTIIVGAGLCLVAVMTLFIDVISRG